MKKIFTERLIIRNNIEDDLEDLFEFNSDPKVNPIAGCSTITDKDKLMLFLQKSKESAFSFVIELKS